MLFPVLFSEVNKKARKGGTIYVPYPFYHIVHLVHMVRTKTGPMSIKITICIICSIFTVFKNRAPAYYRLQNCKTQIKRQLWKFIE